MIDANLESFADELTERMRIRADRIDVIADDPSMWVGGGDATRTISTVEVRRKPTAWLLSAAALIVVLGLGAFALRGSSGAVETAAANDLTILDNVTKVGAEIDVGEAIVWIKPTATAQQIDDIRVFLTTESVVDGFTFASTEETYAEFIEFWADSPEVIDAVSPDDLPTSFRVQTDDPEVLAGLVEGLPGVLKADYAGREQGDHSGSDTERIGPDGETEVDPVVAGPGPLYLLPPEGFQGLEDVSFEDDIRSEDDGDMVVVGRIVPTGFESVVLVAFVDWDPSGPGDNEIEVIDGRELVRGVREWSEAISGGWLLYSTVDRSVLDEVVAATKVVDGEATVDPTLLVELDVLRTIQLTMPDGIVSFDMATPDPRATDTEPWIPLELESVMAAPWVSGPDDIVIWGFIGSSMEETTVRGRTGYLVRPGTTPYNVPWTSLVWTEASGHMVMLTLDDATDEELIAYAESLRIVDRDVWVSELDARVDN